ncbi:MAG: 1-acyl-sn-glycerol-3-phosphate acyltransferase [Caldilineae bacterium]|nr:MAG: 1-acyl-sn-glycerol-3-phosphate acyltransferase [Caldilineae bacterium]
MYRPPQDATFVWKVAHVILTVGWPFVCRLRIEGQEHMPRQGGVVVACNHPGGMDVVFLGYASPRQIYYMAKQELFQIHPAFSALIRLAGAFPVRRGERDLAAIQHSLELVRAGKVLGMFPEGTRNRGGPLGRPKPGAVRIAAQAGAPIVPAGVIGVPQFHREWRDLRRRTPVTVRFGPPLYFNGDTTDPVILHQRMMDVMYAIAALLPPELRGEYDVAAH